MSTDIHLHYGSWDILVAKFCERGVPKDLCIKAMELLGFHAGDQYFILYNEYYEDKNPADVLTSILDESLPDYGKVEYLANSCFNIFLDNTEIQEYLELNEAKAKLGLAITEDEREEDKDDSFFI